MASAFLSASGVSVGGLTALSPLSRSSRSVASFRLSKVPVTVKSLRRVAATRASAAPDDFGVNAEVAGKAASAAVLFSLANAGSAAAAQELMQIADGDARPLILLVVLVPAIGWVLFNILKPALNQINKMRGAKALVGALGLGAAASMVAAPQADAAQEIAQLAVDSRPLLLLTVLVPAVGWVLFNILMPALNQVNKMRGAKGVVGPALGLGAMASLLAAGEADAAQQIADIAADSRPLILLVVLVPAVGWVLFNILQPALRQVSNMAAKNKSESAPKKRR